MPDLWSHLRQHTAARIALGRAGGSLPTAEVLDFSLAHAAARDAVWSELDFDALATELGAAGIDSLRIHSRAGDLATYLQRPDLGRRSDDASLAMLQSSSASTERTGERPLVAIIVADGLSALAAQRHAASVVTALVPRLREAGIDVSPVCLVRHGRVAIQDEIGAALGASAALILIGERPGLGSADSLGAYLVFAPKPGRTDAERNCVSNIRPEGLPPAAAVETILWLLLESLRRRLSGVALKDERGRIVLQTDDSPKAVRDGTSKSPL